jgi:hypothetical protein
LIKYKLIVILLSQLIIFYGIASTGDSFSFFTSFFTFYATLIIDYEKMRKDGGHSENSYLIRLGKIGSMVTVILTTLSILGLLKILVLFKQGNEYYVTITEIMAPNLESGFSIKWYFVLSACITSLLTAAEHFKPNEEQENKESRPVIGDSDGKVSLQAKKPELEG